jgi:hypothetical protein
MKDSLAGAVPVAALVPSFPAAADHFNRIAAFPVPADLPEGGGP